MYHDHDCLSFYQLGSFLSSLHSLSRLLYRFAPGRVLSKVVPTNILRPLTCASVSACTDLLSPNPFRISFAFHFHQHWPNFHAPTFFSSSSTFLYDRSQTCASWNHFRWCKHRYALFESTHLDFLHFFYSRSGYTCTTIYRRDGHIVEMQLGKPSSVYFLFFCI